MQFVQHLYSGVKDATRFSTTVKLFVKSKRLQKLFCQCFILNGFIFVGSVVLLDYIATPLFMVATQSSPTATTPSMMNNNSSITTSSTSSPSLRVNILSLIFSSLKNVFWIWPLYSLSLVLCTFWYNDVAEIAYKMKQRARSSSGGATSSSSSANSLDFRKTLIDKISDNIYRSILLLFFLIQTGLSAHIPVVGPMVAFLMTTWLYAFYAFDYAWGYKNYNTQQRLLYFETHWAYMAGFGAPNAFASYFFPYYINVGIWAMIFPVVCTF